MQEATPSLAIEIARPTAVAVPHPTAQQSALAMLQSAVDRGASMEMVEKLMEMSERMEAAEARRAYNAAFSAFKTEAVEVLKNKRVNFTSSKGTTNYWHAELSDVVAAVAPALARHGLAHSWDVTQTRDWIEVKCILRHALGHSESVSLGGPPDQSGNKNIVQSIASTITMLERQTLKAICGVSEKGDDTDGRTDPGDQDQTERLATLEDQGFAEAGKGMTALLAWWGKVPAHDKNKIGKTYYEMRRAAESADKGANRG